jgi:hypothetical protein
MIFVFFQNFRRFLCFSSKFLMKTFFNQKTADQ